MRLRPASSTRPKRAPRLKRARQRTLLPGMREGDRGDLVHVAGHRPPFSTDRPVGDAHPTTLDRCPGVYFAAYLARRAHEPKSAKIRTRLKGTRTFISVLSSQNKRSRPLYFCRHKITVRVPFISASPLVLPQMNAQRVGFSLRQWGLAERRALDCGKRTHRTAEAPKDAGNAAD